MLTPQVGGNQGQHCKQVTSACNKHAAGIAQDQLRGKRGLPIDFLAQLRAVRGPGACTGSKRKLRVHGVEERAGGASSSTGETSYIPEHALMDALRAMTNERLESFAYEEVETLVDDLHAALFLFATELADWGTLPSEAVILIYREVHCLLMLYLEWYRQLDSRWTQALAGRGVVSCLLGLQGAPATVEAMLQLASDDLEPFRRRSVEQNSNDIHQVLFTMAFQAGRATREGLQMSITKCHHQVCTVMSDFGRPDPATGRFKDVEGALVKATRLALGQVAILSGCPPVPGMGDLTLVDEGGGGLLSTEGDGAAAS